MKRITPIPRDQLSPETKAWLASKGVRLDDVYECGHIEELPDAEAGKSADYKPDPSGRWKNLEFHRSMLAPDGAPD
jgi:hypothetical protein